MKIRIALLAALLGAGAALANDSVAETAAGGLVLKRTAEIDMVSEDLFISPAAVRVRYVFRNPSAKPVRATVAFPLPDRDLESENYSDVAFPDEFRTRVDGKPVAMKVERKALLDAIDHTKRLETLGIPIAGLSGRPLADSVAEAFLRLSKAHQAELVRLGLVGIEGDDIFPRWTVRETWYWQQAFPAGRDLKVEHSYTPGTGASVGTGLAMPEFRRSAEGRATIRDYCVDSAFLAGVDRLARQAGGDYPTLPEQRIGYVLTTGANWRSPIRDFRLVVDKGSPANLVSFCGGGVRKISPTRFEMRRRNWRPDRDLRILIVGPAAS
ncbi:MAG TPA: DUF4424 domain-containing protein [Allosphingosinicella sp.]|nr:DUF4424 domain-containing protein [Allosphingosinicella sp.]